ncbi:MAG TPA: hypothetical protein VF997_04850, partial [Polyangia bacterium]
MKVRQYARRHPSGLPAVWGEGVRSFYAHLHAPAGPMVCDGTSCHFAGAALPDGVAPVRCLGRCYEPPATSAT